MKCKRMATLGLAAALTLSLLTIPALAANFTDIGSHWAKGYIQDMADKGLVKGYEDNTYRPNLTLKASEGLAFCARTLGLSSALSKEVAEKWEDTLDELLDGEMSWGHTELAACLEAGVLTRAELKSLISSGALNRDLSRESLAVYMVRAMGLDLLAESQTSYPLGFTDLANIETGIRPYVYLLNMYGIITGNEKNEFQPDKGVNRAEMAAILSRVLAFRESRGIVTELADFTDYEFVSGTVTSVVTANSGATVITLDDGFSKEPVAVALPATAKIYQNNMQAELKVMKSGDFVRVSLDRKGNATAVRIGGEMTSVSGTVVSFTDEALLVTIGGVPKTISMDRFTRVEAGGEVGDRNILDQEAQYTTAQAAIDGRGKAVAVRFEGGSSRRVGLFAGSETVTNSTNVALKVTGYDGVVERYVMPDSVIIAVNGVPGKNSAISGYNGKFVTVRVSNDTGLVTGVDFDTATTYIQGGVRSITWQSATQSISIINLATMKYTSYTVAKDVKATYNGAAVEFKDVQPDWFVTARQSGGEVVELVCYPGSVATTGVLDAMDFAKVPQVTLSVKREDGAVIDFIVDVNDLPLIKRNTERSGIDKLKIGDNLVVTVKYSEVTLIEATARTANLSGTIESIAQTQAGDTMVVKLKDGTQATYTVSTSTSITKDGKAVAFSTLKVGYQISMVTDGDKLSSIEVDEATVAANSMTGTVVYINSGDKTILFKENGADTPISVFAGMATIMGTDGTSLRLGDLKAGDALMVYGAYNGLTFRATMILR